MTTRKETIEYCLSFPNSYEYYPFDDYNWTVMRRKDTNRGFCWIFERNNNIWLNIKVVPEWGRFWRDVYPSVLPGYHMNKEHWNSIILDGTVPKEEIQSMISESYNLCGNKRVKHKASI